MKLTASRTPSLAEVIGAAVYQGLYDVHTAMPGRIEKYDQAEQKADVKPLLKRKVVFGDGTSAVEDLPVIPSVPVAFPRGGGFFISWPLVAGDFVLLVFAERSIDAWITGEGVEAEPTDLRMHDLSDAIALPCLAPFSKAIADVAEDGLVAGKDAGGAQLVIGSDGSVEVRYDGGVAVRVEGKDGAAKLTVGDGAKHVAVAEALQSLWGSLKSTLDLWGGPAGHVHTSAAPGSPTTPPVTPLSTPAWDPGVASTSVALPG